MRTISNYISELNQIKEIKDATFEEILKLIFASYSNNRIKNTKLSEDGDMLLIQWNIEKGKLIISIVRQVFSQENEDIEFDDLAQQLELKLEFKIEIKVEISHGNFWIEKPRLKIEDYFYEIKSKNISKFLTRIPNSIEINKSYI